MITQEEHIYPNLEHGRMVFYADQGESNARRLVFLLHDAFGAEVSITTGRAILYIRKPDNNVAVIECGINADGRPNAVSCILTYQASTVAGRCSMYLQLLPGNEELIYDRLELLVKPSILENIISLPELGPLSQIIQDAEELPALAALMEEAKESIAQADEAAERAKEGVKPPYIGANGNWYVWDTEEEHFEDSGVLAEGQNGKPGYLTRIDFGMFSMGIRSDGHLILLVNEADTPPPLEIDRATGHLIYKLTT